LILENFVIAMAGDQSRYRFRPVGGDVVRFPLIGKKDNTPVDQSVGDCDLGRVENLKGRKKLRRAAQDKAQRPFAVITACGWARTPSRLHRVLSASLRGRAPATVADAPLACSVIASACGNSFAP
jgi:hypothetical protein